MWQNKLYEQYIMHIGVTYFKVTKLFLFLLKIKIIIKCNIYLSKKRNVSTWDANIKIFK